MFGSFSEDARKILINAKSEMCNLCHPYVGSEHLLLSILKSNNVISDKLKSYNLTYDVFKDELIKIVGVGSKKSEWFLYTPLLKRVLENAIVHARDENRKEVFIEHLFLGLLEEGDGIAIRIMVNLGIDIDLLYDEFSYNIKSFKNSKLLLDEFGVDLTLKALNNEIDPVIGRDNEIERILEILSRRTKNNPILLGDAGVGKTAIVEELARLISIGKVPRNLANKRLISVDMASLIAGTKYRGEFEDRISKVLKEIENDKNIILFIDEIHTLVGAGGAEGAIDASNIFKPALARGKIRLIGATTCDEYKKYIEKDSALDRRFQRVDVVEPDKESTINILLGLKHIYEDFHLVNISDEILKKIVYFSNKYIYDRREPDKSIDLLDEVCAHTSLKETVENIKYKELYKSYQDIKVKKEKSILDNDFKLAKALKRRENKLIDSLNTLELMINNNIRKDVSINDLAYVLNKKTNIPVYEILNDFTNLENNYKEIIGQDKAIEKLISLKKKIKLGYKNSHSLLFVGPSGVGKTKLATLFGKDLVNDNIIKLDMSEYTDPASINKILGAPPGYVGYEDNKNILEEIKNKPNSLLIVDEVEKAHPSIINLFLQILEDKKIKDNKGRIIRFDNVVVIFTSNIGFDNDSIGFNSKTSNDIKTQLKSYFSIPFINRIDEIILFDNLNKFDIMKLVDIKLESLKAKYDGKIIVRFSDSIKEEILELTDYEKFGARQIDKVIDCEVENLIIDSLLNKENEIMIDTILKRVTL